jgi:hypothetical protein
MEFVSCCRGIAPNFLIGKLELSEYAARWASPRSNLY